MIAQLVGNMFDGQEFEIQESPPQEWHVPMPIPPTLKELVESPEVSKYKTAVFKISKMTPGKVYYTFDRITGD